MTMPDPSTPPLVRRPAFVIGLVATLVTAMIATALGTLDGSAAAAGTLLSQGKPAVASSVENAATPASAAVDGDPGTRWSSDFSDPQWLRIDLGATSTIDSVQLVWEAAYARTFRIQVSDDATTWRDATPVVTGVSGTQTVVAAGTGRYVRMLGSTRATGYGYSLWEFRVYGDSGSATTCAATNQAQGRPAAASSVENPGTPASAAVDGDPGTRWASAFSDPQWLRVDLGARVGVCGVTLTWEAAYATGFAIQVSDDATTWTDAYRSTTGTGGTQTLALDAVGRYVRVLGTARATGYGYSLWEFAVRITAANPTPTATPTPPTPTPTTPTPTTTQTPTPPGYDAFWGDTSTIPAANNVLMLKILNRTNGRYRDDQVFWSYNGEVRSIAEQPYFDMPANTAGRMYFHLGSPTSRYTDFIEFTVGPDVFNGNTTRVDGFSLKLAMRLHARDGYDRAVGEDLATFAEDRAETFQRFIDEVPAEFDDLARIEAPYRIPAPNNSPDFRPGGRYEAYLSSYAASVGVNATTSEITGCSGPLAEAPGLCSALNRHVAQLPPSQWSTPSLYYQSAPANYYSKFWHDHAIDALAYGFPYDDFASQSSFIARGDPEYLLVAVGW